jgi:hypothetical protein
MRVERLVSDAVSSQVSYGSCWSSAGRTRSAQRPSGPAALSGRSGDPLDQLDPLGQLLDQLDPLGQLVDQHFERRVHKATSASHRRAYIPTASTRPAQPAQGGIRTQP